MTIYNVVVLADFDLTPPPVRAVDRIQSKANGVVPNTLFEPRSGTFSLGQETIDKFQGDRTWPSPKPDHTYYTIIVSIVSKYHDSCP